MHEKWAHTSQAPHTIKYLGRRQTGAAGPRPGENAYTAMAAARMRKPDEGDAEADAMARAAL